MSTWHQDAAMRRAYKAGKPMSLQHETLWSVVVDPPNELRTITLARTKKDAEDHMDRLIANGQEHVYVLRPLKRTEDRHGIPDTN